MEPVTLYSLKIPHEERNRVVNAVTPLIEDYIQQHGRRPPSSVIRGWVNATGIPVLVVAIRGIVYNLTDFAFLHPGGVDILFQYSGTDATLAFERVNHSSNTRAYMRRFAVARLAGASLDPDPWGVLGTASSNAGLGSSGANENLAPTTQAQATIASPQEETVTDTDADTLHAKQTAPLPNTISTVPEPTSPERVEAQEQLQRQPRPHTEEHLLPASMLELMSPPASRKDRKSTDSTSLRTPASWQISPASTGISDMTPSLRERIPGLVPTTEHIQRTSTDLSKENLQDDTNVVQRLSLASPFRNHSSQTRQGENLSEVQEDRQQSLTELHKESFDRQLDQSALLELDTAQQVMEMADTGDVPPTAQQGSQAAPDTSSSVELPSVANVLAGWSPDATRDLDFTVQQQAPAEIEIVTATATRPTSQGVLDQSTKLVTGAVLTSARPSLNADLTMAESVSYAGVEPSKETDNKPSTVAPLTTKVVPVVPDAVLETLDLANVSKLAGDSSALVQGASRFDPRSESVQIESNSKLGLDITSMPTNIAESAEGEGPTQPFEAPSLLPLIRFPSASSDSPAEAEAGETAKPPGSSVSHAAVDESGIPPSGVAVGGRARQAASATPKPPNPEVRLLVETLKAVQSHPSPRISAQTPAAQEASRFGKDHSLNYTSHAMAALLQSLNESRLPSEQPCPASESQQVDREIDADVLGVEVVDAVTQAVTPSEKPHITMHDVPTEKPPHPTLPEQLTAPRIAEGEQASELLPSQESSREEDICVEDGNLSVVEVIDVTSRDVRHVASDPTVPDDVVVSVSTVAGADLASPVKVIRHIDSHGNSGAPATPAQALQTHDTSVIPTEPTNLFDPQTSQIPIVASTSADVSTANASKFLELIQSAVQKGISSVRPAVPDHETQPDEVGSYNEHRDRSEAQQTGAEIMQLSSKLEELRTQLLHVKQQVDQHEKHLIEHIDHSAKRDESQLVIPVLDSLPERGTLAAAGTDISQFLELYAAGDDTRAEVCPERVGQSSQVGVPTQSSGSAPHQHEVMTGPESHITNTVESMYSAGRTPQIAQPTIEVVPISERLQSFVKRDAVQGNPQQTAGHEVERREHEPQGSVMESSTFPKTLMSLPKPTAPETSRDASRLNESELHNPLKSLQDEEFDNSLVASFLAGYNRRIKLQQELQNKSEYQPSDIRPQSSQRQSMVPVQFQSTSSSGPGLVIGNVEEMQLNCSSPRKTLPKVPSTTPLKVVSTSLPATGASQQQGGPALEGFRTAAPPRRTFSHINPQPSIAHSAHVHRQISIAPVVDSLPVASSAHPSISRPPGTGPSHRLPLPTQDVGILPHLSSPMKAPVAAVTRGMPVPVPSAEAGLVGGIPTQDASHQHLAMPGLAASLPRPTVASPSGQPPMLASAADHISSPQVPTAPATAGTALSPGAAHPGLLANHFRALADLLTGTRTIEIPVGSNPIPVQVAASVRERTQPGEAATKYSVEPLASKFGGSEANNSAAASTSLTVATATPQHRYLPPKIRTSLPSSSPLYYADKDHPLRSLEEEIQMRVEARLKAELRARHLLPQASAPTNEANFRNSSYRQPVNKAKSDEESELELSALNLSMLSEQVRKASAPVLLDPTELKRAQDTSMNLSDRSRLLPRHLSDKFSANDESQVLSESAQLHAISRSRRAPGEKQDDHALTPSFLHTSQRAAKSPTISRLQTTKVHARSSLEDSQSAANITPADSRTPAKHTKFETEVSLPAQPPTLPSTQVSRVEIANEVHPQPVDPSVDVRGAVEPLPIDESSNERALPHTPPQASKDPIGSGTEGDSMSSPQRKGHTSAWFANLSPASSLGSSDLETPPKKYKPRVPQPSPPQPVPLQAQTQSQVMNPPHSSNGATPATKASMSHRATLVDPQATALQLTSPFKHANAARAPSAAKQVLSPPGFPASARSQMRPESYHNDFPQETVQPAAMPSLAYRGGRTSVQMKQAGPVTLPPTEVHHHTYTPAMPAVPSVVAPTYVGTTVPMPTEATTVPVQIPAQIPVAPPAAAVVPMHHAQGFPNPAWSVASPGAIPIAVQQPPRNQPVYMAMARPLGSSTALSTSTADGFATPASIPLSVLQTAYPIAAAAPTVAEGAPARTVPISSPSRIGSSTLGSSSTSTNAQQGVGFTQGETLAQALVRGYQAALNESAMAQLSNSKSVSNSHLEEVTVQDISHISYDAVYRPGAGMRLDGSFTHQMPHVHTGKRFKIAPEEAMTPVAALNAAGFVLRPMSRR